MDHLLAGYASSSSSSAAGDAAGGDTDVSLLPGNRVDALSENPPGNFGGAGRGGNRTEGKACNFGRDGDAGGVVGECVVEKGRLGEDAAGVDLEGESRAAKKRRRVDQPNKRAEGQPKYAASVIIAGCNESLDNDQAFERSHPHWEGRWAGHVYLPLPPLEALDEAAAGAKASGDALENESDDSDSSEGSSDDEEDMQHQSRLFLPAARRLIHHWATVLGGKSAPDRKGCEVAGQEEGMVSAIVVVPHIPMHPIEAKGKASREASLPGTSLHISLARPIYLPGPSVGPFLSDLEKSLAAALAVANGKSNATTRQEGMRLVLQPRNATIFTNDQRTRSFLSIPVSANSAHWAKRMLLPSIDATMLRFGLETYYSTTEEGCILHVSVASVKGNVIPRMQCLRGPFGDEDESQARSIQLFANEETDEEERVLVECLAEAIPVEVDRIECVFGSARRLAIPLRR